jgi:hypothetical protein
MTHLLYVIYLFSEQNCPLLLGSIVIGSHFMWNIPSLISLLMALFLILLISLSLEELH